MSGLAMVMLFVRLKLRLIGGNLRGDVSRQVGFAFSVLAATALALAGFALLALLRLGPADLARDAGVVIFALIAIGWMLGPLLAFGVDETLDPSRLALFPLTTRRLATGLLAASIAGPWPLATLIALAGGVAGLARGAGGVVAGPVAVVLLFGFCLVASRAITTALSGVLRSRRGRDLLMIAAAALVVASQLPGLLVNRGLPGDPQAVLASTAEALRWTPPGLAVHAIADPGPAGVAELAVLALIVVALGWLWITALRRALVSPDSSTVRGGSVRRARIGRFLPQGMLGAVVAKELKYARRDPRGRVGWFSAIAVCAFLMLSLRGPGGWDGPPSVIVPVTLAALVIGLQAANSFGIDGRSLWMNAVAFATERDLRTDLAGRHLALALIAVPLLTVVSVTGAVLAGDSGRALVVAATAWGVLGVSLGVGAVTSVLVPYTVPERFNAFTGAAPGQGGQAFLASFGSMLSTGALVTPIVLPVLLGAYHWCLLAPPYGIAVAWAGRRLAASIGFNRLPELVAAVSRPA